MVSVGIGMPVYNGGPLLEQAIRCILAQTYPDFDLLISDNCSTDGTSELCLAFARSDSRIRYVRQSKNIGAEANFRYVFTQSAGDYFMWAAADDLRSADFLEANLAFLRNHPEYVGSTSPVRFANGTFGAVRMGDFSLVDYKPYRRVLDFLSLSHANGRFYSLFRRNVVASWPHLSDSAFLGSDWTLVTHAAARGKLHRSVEGWVVLGDDGVSNRTDIFKRFRKSKLDWLVPFRKMSSDIMASVGDAPFTIRVRVLSRLVLINARAVLVQFLVAYRRRNSKS